MIIMEYLPVFCHLLDRNLLSFDRIQQLSGCGFFLGLPIGPKHWKIIGDEYNNVCHVKNRKSHTSIWHLIY